MIAKKAIGLYHQALKRTDSLTNNEGPKAMILANMSNIYTDIEAYKKSIATLDRLLVVTDTIRSFSKIKAAALVGQSINHTKLEDYEKGLEYGNRALELASYMGDKGVTASVLNSISDIYLAQKEFEKALDATQKGLNLEVAKKHTKTRGWLLLNEGIALYNLSRFENSLSSFKASLAQEKELPLIEMYSYENLAKLYEQQENFEKSFQAQKEYSRIKNTIDGYNERNFYVGLAAPNAVGDLLSSEKNIELRVPYYGCAGYKLYLGAQEEFFLKPNALITVIQDAPKQVDMNMFVNYKSKLEAGIGYRTNSLIYTSRILPL